MVRFLDLISSRLLWLAVMAVIVVKFIIPFGIGGLANISDTLGDIDVHAIVTRTNQERSALGLPPLTFNAVLENAAQARLDDMAAQNYFEHVNPDGLWPWHFIALAGYGYDVAGENLARGFYDPERLVNAWMASVPHRANIVNGTYEDVGVAARRIIVDGKATLVVVQLFASPDTSRAVAGVTVATPTPVPTPAAVPQDPERPRFAFSGAQAVSNAPGAPTVAEPVRADAFGDDTLERVADTSRGALSIWLLVVASIFLAFAVMEGRHRFLMVSAAHVALLMVLTMAPSLRAFSGYIL